MINLAAKSTATPIRLVNKTENEQCSSNIYHKFSCLLRKIGHDLRL